MKKLLIIILIILTGCSIPSNKIEDVSNYICKGNPYGEEQVTGVIALGDEIQTIINKYYNNPKENQSVDIVYQDLKNIIDNIEKQKGLDIYAKKEEDKVAWFIKLDYKEWEGQSLNIDLGSTQLLLNVSSGLGLKEWISSLEKNGMSCKKVETMEKLELSSK